jgi:hypothetical protein
VKRGCSDVSPRLLEKPNLTDKVLNGDETWFFQCSPGTKYQSLQWKSPEFLSEKKKQKCENHFDLHFYTKKIVCYEFISPKQLTRHPVFKFLNFYNSERPCL